MAASEHNLVNTQGLLAEQEVILKNVLARSGSRESAIRPAHIVPTESLTVPDQEVLLVGERMAQAFENRPDLLQTGLQIVNSEISLSGTRNSLQLRNQAQLEVDDAVIALRRARAAYDAAVKTRKLQQQSLDIEQYRYQNGVSTSFFVIQYQAYLTQARSTKEVARSNYFKARPLSTGLRVLLWRPTTFQWTRLTTET